MSKTEKLLQKLRNKTLSTKEAQTLLNKLGWVDRGTEGSHQQWVGPNNEKYTLVISKKDLKPYQLKDLNKLIFKE